MYNFLENFYLKGVIRILGEVRKAETLSICEYSILQSLALTSRTIKVVLKYRHFNILKNKLIKDITESKHNSY